MCYDFDIQDYLFDLRGYIFLKNAVSPDLVERLNRAIDHYIDLEYLEWRGNVQRFDNNANAGMELQNIVEGGEPFEELIDHPAGTTACCGIAVKRTVTWRVCISTNALLPSAGREVSPLSIPGTRMESCAINTVSSTISSAAAR